MGVVTNYVITPSCGATAEEITHIKWKPDGSQFVITDLRGGISLLDASTGQKTGYFRTSGTGIDWSPDRTKVVSISVYSDVIYISDLKNDQIVAPLEGHTGTLLSVGWSPDGHKIASGGMSDAPTIRIWNSSTGNLLFTLEGHTDDILDLKWSPDSTKIASASTDGSVRVWNIITGQQLSVFESKTSISSVDWHPDGTKRLFTYIKTSNR